MALIIIVIFHINSLWSFKVTVTTGKTGDQSIESYHLLSGPQMCQTRIYFSGRVRMDPRSNDHGTPVRTLNKRQVSPG